MRSRRAAALLTGALLAAPLAAAPAVGGATAAPTSRPAERDVQVGSRIVAEGGTLLLAGKVAGSDGPVLVQQATTCRALAFGSFQCDWKPYDEVRLARDGSYRTAVEVPEEEGRQHGLYWRAVVGRDAGPIWRTYRATG